MTTDLRSLDLACMDCGKHPSYYFPPGSFSSGAASFLCIPCAEQRVVAVNYEMHVRERLNERAKAILDAVKRACEPPAPPLPSGTLCSGKPPLPDVVVSGSDSEVK